LTTRRWRRAWFTSSRLQEALIVAALVLLPLLFWWRLWTPNAANRAVIPAGDLDGQYYPLQLFAARQAAAGHLAAWDPYLNAGQPGLADIQTGAWYPPNLALNLILAALGLPFNLGLLTAQIIFHFSLASLFTYLFVRHLACRAGARLPAARFAGAIAALSFTYAGYLTTFPVQQITILETAVWLPLVLLFLDRAAYSAHPRPQIILAGLALAAAFLAGHPQTAMYAVYTTVAYGLFLAWPATPRRAPEPFRITPHVSRLTYHASRLATYALAPVLLGLALAAVQLVPSLAFIARSTRAGLDYEAVSWGFPLAEITHLLYPGYFGGSPQYVGILPPILAVAALFLPRARRQVLFWLVVAGVAFLLAFGGNTFLYDVAYLLAPGFGAVRDQERVIYLFSLAVSVLAGYGALLLVQPLPRLVRKGVCRYGRSLGWVFVAALALTALWYLGYLQGVQQQVEINMFEGVLRHHTLILLVLGGSVALLALRLTGRAGRRGMMALALALVWLNLFTINWQFNLAEPGSGGSFPETGLVTFLKEQPGTFRISSACLLPGGASAGVVYQLEDITANTPLRLDAFQQFEDRVGSWRRWQLLNVEYVLSDQDLTGPGLEQVYQENQIKVYQVGDPLPRAWMVYRTTMVSGDQAIDRLNAQGFDPRLTAILAPGAEVPALSGQEIPTGSAQVIESVPGRLVLDLSSGGDGLLVISQPYYPGWRARLDDQDVPVLRVDYMLQGVSVSAGHHRLELVYRLSLLPAAISLIALIGCLAGLVLKRPSA
jgi:hypothetical protein